MGRRLESKGFGQRLKQARLQFGTNRLATLGQEELGGLLGVSGVTIGRWEEGNREPGSLGLLERLAAVLGVSPGWLAFGEGAMQRGGRDDLSKYAPADEVPEDAYVSVEERNKQKAARKAALKKRA